MIVNSGGNEIYTITAKGLLGVLMVNLKNMKMYNPKKEYK